MLFKSIILTTLLTQILANIAPKPNTDSNQGISLRKRHFDYDDDDDDYQCYPEPNCRVGWLPTRNYSDYCREGEGYCARDGGYYICKDGVYCKKYCGCRDTTCVEDDDSFSCKYEVGPGPGPEVCGPEPNLVLGTYVYGGRPDSSSCFLNSGFCASDGGYYICINGRGYRKADCGCPNTKCGGYNGKLACVTNRYYA